MKRNIYFADDEKNIRELISSFLESEGYVVTCFADGLSCWQTFQKKPCDLAILDITMPQMDGHEVCRKIREISTIPIIFLSARNSELDYATGINIGSDDYFTKPFSAMSLLMRVKAIFRRIDMDTNSFRSSKNKLSIGNITLSTDTKELFIDNHHVRLTPNEYDLMEYLLIHQERGVSRDEVLQKIWGFDCDVETRAVDDTVRRLRKKLQPSNVSINTIWGFGFHIQTIDNEIQ